MFSFSLRGKDDFSMIFERYFVVEKFEKNDFVEGAKLLFEGSDLNG